MCVCVCVCVVLWVGLRIFSRSDIKSRQLNPTQEFNNHPQRSIKRPQMCSGHYVHTPSARIWSGLSVCCTLWLLNTTGDIESSLFEVIVLSPQRALMSFQTKELWETCFSSIQWNWMVTKIVWSSFVFRKRRKVINVWSDMRVSKWWQKCFFFFFF